MKRPTEAGLVLDRCVCRPDEWIEGVVKAAKFVKSWPNEVLKRVVKATDLVQNWPGRGEGALELSRQETSSS